MVFDPSNTFAALPEFDDAAGVPVEMLEQSTTHRFGVEVAVHTDASREDDTAVVFVPEPYANQTLPVHSIA